MYGGGGLWGECPHCFSLLQGCIEVAWPLRIEILLGLLVFTRVELRQGHDVAVVHIALSAGAFSSWGPARFSFCFCQRQHHLLSGLFCRPPLHSKCFLILLDTGSALLT